MINYTNVLKIDSNKFINCESIQKGYNIPNIIHQTFCSKLLPIQIVETIKNNKKKCKNCKFYFYDDEDCDNLIKNNFNELVYNAYKKINPAYGAMRADFFRYCVLYLYGGIYLDIKSKINISIFSIIKKEDTCILDLPRNNLEIWRKNMPTYEQWLLIFSPRHPYLLSMIKLMLKYINENYVPISIDGILLSRKGVILNLTGPDAFTLAINSFIKSNNIELHRNINYCKYFSLNENSNYRNMYKINNKKHYSEVNEPIYLN